MDSTKALFALLAGATLTTVIGILLAPYKDSSKRKKVVEKAKDYTETIKDSVTHASKAVKKMEEDTDRMANEGGRVV